MFQCLGRVLELLQHLFPSILIWKQGHTVYSPLHLSLQPRFPLEGCAVMWMKHCSEE